MPELEDLCNRAKVELQTLQSFSAGTFPSLASVYLHLLAVTLASIHVELVALDAEVQVLHALAGTAVLGRGPRIASVVSSLAELNRIVCFDLGVTPSELLLRNPPATLRVGAREIRAHARVLRDYAWAEFTKWRALEETLRVYAILSEYRIPPCV
jgi:hypothetical protein